MPLLLRPIFRAHLRKLRDVGDAILARVAEAEARPKALALAAEFVELTRKAVNSWPEVKPWLEKEDVDALSAQVGRQAHVGDIGLRRWRVGAPRAAGPQVWVGMQGRCASGSSHHAATRPSAWLCG